MIVVGLGPELRVGETSKDIVSIAARKKAKEQLTCDGLRGDAVRGRGTARVVVGGRHVEHV